MSTATLTQAPTASEESSDGMTTEQLLALPEDNRVDRWLIRGRLIERPMTRRGYSHSRTQTRLAQLLQNWLDHQPTPRGAVVSGEAGFRLGPSSSVGIDVAYVSAERVAATPKNAFLIEGAPILAVEIMSPSDQIEDISDKIEEYLAAGAALVWRVEPALDIITVFRPDAGPESFNVHDEITAEPHLPGFRVTVAEIFG